MKLYTFEYRGKSHIGAEQDGKLVDLNAAALAASISPPPSSMLEFVQAGESALRAAREALAHARSTNNSQLVHSFADVRLLAPIKPGKILCSGVNYRSHLDENPQGTLPETPFFFSKVPSAVIGPGQPIVVPKLSKQVDYEVEFAVVIGKTLHNVSESQVMDGIFGYTILHDVSARDVQFKDNQITLGKNFDTFAPMGPCIVTTDELTDPSNVSLRTLLNGQVMQDDSTRNWVFPLPHFISSLAQVMTLEPGDVVSTGTPGGVAFFRNPQPFLKHGDQVILEIAGIGRLENPVIAAS